MPLERRIHSLVQYSQFTRIETDQMRAEFPQTRTHTFGVGGQIERTQRTDFAIPRQPLIGFDADNRAVKYRDRFSARPVVRTFDQGQFNAVGKYPSDLHALESRLKNRNEVERSNFSLGSIRILGQIRQNTTDSRTEHRSQNTAVRTMTKNEPQSIRPCRQRIEINRTTSNEM